MDNKKAMGKHETLVDILTETLRTTGHIVKKHVEYAHGELDVYDSTTRTYYEVKCNMTPTSINTARSQIERAIKNDQCRYGYLVTYQGVMDVLL